MSTNSEPQINSILTVQNQLESLTALHSTKPAVSRLFDYLNSLTPSQISITNYTSDFTQQTVTVTGSADALSTVNQFQHALGQVAARMMLQRLTELPPDMPGRHREMPFEIVKRQSA